jgi:hypothetical protein
MDTSYSVYFYEEYNNYFFQSNSEELEIEGTYVLIESGLTREQAKRLVEQKNA